MGTNMERSNLYLKLFKLVFGSVSLFASENEQMLKPHLHEIVNRSMELACTSKEPYNYFLLLRALFRSIGGGSHDLLYQEFLPLLPNLLQGLNNLQSGIHRQYMKDLFVELCLTVPVRLSSLLPYLPMLMDPLVSALNGSQTLVSQGLRTLELCVDNLQPDFLYDHIQPVRAELFQALWKTLRNPHDSIAHVAFRVLGKFGGGNRRMLKEPQKLRYNSAETSGPCLSIFYPESTNPVSLPVTMVIDKALTVLKTLPPNMTVIPQQSPMQIDHTVFYREQAWLVVQSFLIAMMSLEDTESILHQVLSHRSFRTENPPTVNKTAVPPCIDELSKKVFEQAITGVLLSGTIKELKAAAVPFVSHLVRHFTIVGVVQQAGPCPIKPQARNRRGMDIHVMVDAIAAVMAMEDKEFYKVGELAVAVMIETASAITGDGYKAARLPLFEYLSEKLCGCCYERAWFAKNGGCTAINFLMKRMPLQWVIEHQLSFINALCFVMMDLTNEVSAGTVDSAKRTLEALLRQCNEPQTGEESHIKAVRERALPTVTQHLVREIVSPNQTIRQQAQRSVSVLAEIYGRSVHSIMLPHKTILEDMIPPKKHLLRHQPVNTQIALMDGNTFCTTLTPRLFTMDLTIMEHKVFFHELLSLCEADDSQLLKLPCYKTVQSLTPLRKSALNALTACHYITQVKDKIFNVLYKALNSPTTEIQEAAKNCMKKFMAGSQVDMEQVHMSIRPLLLKLGDYRSLNLQLIQRLSHLMELFPGSFNEKLCEQLLAHLKKWIEVITTGSTQTQQVAAKTSHSSEDVAQELKICASIINMFYLIPAASSKLIEPLINLVLKVEKSLLMEVGSPLREPLLKFLIRYPTQTVDFFLLQLSGSQMNRLLMYVLSQESSKPLRQTLEAHSLKLVNSTFSIPQPPEDQVQAVQKKMELQNQGIQIIRLLVKFNDSWLPEHPVLIGHLRRIWVSNNFQERLKKDGTPIHRWREPKLLAKCLLNYIKHRPTEVELLFQLLRVFTIRHVPDFHFLRTFLDEKVAKGYSVEQKRAVFFKFVALFHDQNFPQELKAKALQYVLIPMFQVSFERGEGDALIGGPPSPEQDSNENVISVFVSRVVDPVNPFGTSDAVRILLLQFSALLVEHASQHIHDASNKKQGQKLRRLMTFAWPCLLPKQCVDPSTKYHGHLLLAHIIAKFAIHKRIVMQVFHSLLKAHAVEARGVVRQALDILTPAMPARMEDENTKLTHWTKKIIVEEGHTVAQLVHMLTLLVRHYRVYYPVRIHLIQHMVSAMQRLGFTANASIEHRKLAVDLAEVILKWELQRIKDDQEQTSNQEQSESSASAALKVGGVKRPSEESATPEAKRTRSLSQGTVSRVSVQEGQAKSPLEKHHADAVVNFLLRIACQVNEPSTTMGSPGETLSRRCVALLKTALRPDVWPGTDLRVGWLDKILVTVDQTPAANYANVCTAIEILTYLLSVLPQQTILTLFKPLQRGIATCMTCQNTKVIRAIHTLLARLMTLFPLESAAPTSKYEELETLYGNIGKVIYDGLTNYERSANGATSIFYGPLMMLKAACSHNPSYIDRLMAPFFKALQRMHKDHINAVLGESTGASEMLILCLELIRSRLGIMNVEMRRLFFVILSTLIEKSPDSKLLRAITKIVEDWIKTKVTQLTIQRLPILREKSALLVRMMANYEKRFPEDFELQAQFLELVNYVYRDENLVSTELASKLEPAFLSGLRCIQPQIRSRFMEVFDKTMKKKLYDRLLYIFCSQNWEAMGPHFWIKQCIELLLAVSACERPVTPSSTFSMLPSVTSFIRVSDNPASKEILARAQQKSTAGSEDAKDEKMETESSKEGESKKEDGSGRFLFEIDDSETLLTTMDKKAATSRLNKEETVQQLIERHGKFIEKLREVKTISFLRSMAQLCHRYSNLAHQVWVDLFPQLWNLLTEKQQQVLAGEISPFMCSGSHLVQVDTFPSSVHTILEGVSKCNPAVPIRPCILKYLGKSHNSWHRAGLTLEDYASLCDEYSTHQISHQQQQVIDFSPFEEDPSEINQHETMDALAEMYSLLNEEDMWAGLWQQRCRYPETATAIAYETQGFYEQAQSAYEMAMSKAREEHNRGPANPQLNSEYNLWEEHWINCSKELGQWDLLMEFGKTKGHANPFLVLESAWRVPEWQSMKEALAQVEVNFPESMAYKLNLYRGYIAICHPEEQHLNMVDKLVEHSTTQAIRQWRRLPPVISQQHIPLLQAAQQIMELQEAAQIHTGLQPPNVGRSTSLHDMKAIVKTWRNRLPMPSDNLSHWSDVFMWRHHHYQAIVAAYENQAQHEPQSNHSMLGVHASAWAIIHYGYIARKQNLTGVCLDWLSRIHTIPSVPIVDCFQKIKQQVKCYLQMAGGMGKQELQEGLEVIESTNLKYFSKEMTAEFFALKGMFLAYIGRSEDANKAFSQAVQMHDSLVMAWALWGDYLDGLFVLERNMQLGVSAIVCYLHACRHQNEAKCRKYLARTIWLMTYDDEKGSISEAVDKYCVGVPPVHWLPWIPQLLTCLVRREGQKILNLLCNIGRVHPQAMYFPIRTLYLTWKIEQRERHKMEAAAAGISAHRSSTGGTNTTASSDSQNANSAASKTSTTGSETGQTSTAAASTTATGTAAASSQASAENAGSLKAATTTASAPPSTSSSTPTAPAHSNTTTAPTPTSTAGSATSSTTAGSTTATTGTSQSTGSTPASSQSDPGAIRATAQMWRCSKIMHLLRDLHPTLLSALEGVVDQMVWFRECWHEEVLRQLRQGLTKCYQVAFETRGDVASARITPHTLSFVKKLVSTFGIGFESASSVSSTFSSAASESLARRAQATAQDPVFQRLKEQFAIDFDFR
ncbi:unnamed protein product [Porites evermanni]|uniref:FAT domain-containing protein n=1 Tax=Porites evermanni TaxID=104178 RepID=A0ABN8M4G0_9CNID|nr:unnamed protein product [Porites evermanni]